MTPVYGLPALLSLGGSKADRGADVTPSIAFPVAGGERPGTYRSRKAR